MENLKKLIVVLSISALTLGCSDDSWSDQKCETEAQNLLYKIERAEADWNAGRIDDDTYLELIFKYSNELEDIYRKCS